MKQLTILLSIILLSCQSEKGKQSEQIAQMAEKKLEFSQQYGHENAQAKMILTYGEEKVRWFDSINASYDKADSTKQAIEQAQIDSVNQTIK